MTLSDRLGLWILIGKVKRLNRLIGYIQRIERNKPMASAALLAAIASAKAAADNVVAYVNTLKASQDETGAIADVNAVASELNALIPLSVSPATASSAVGSAVSQSLSVSGGVAPYSASSSSADVTASVSGGTVTLSGTPAAAEDVTITVTDSSPTPQSAEMVLTVS